MRKGKGYAEGTYINADGYINTDSEAEAEVNALVIVDENKVM